MDDKTSTSDELTSVTTISSSDESGINKKDTYRRESGNNNIHKIDRDDHFRNKDNRSVLSIYDNHLCINTNSDFDIENINHNSNEQVNFSKKEKDSRSNISTTNLDGRTLGNLECERLVFNETNKTLVNDGSRNEEISSYENINDEDSAKESLDSLLSNIDIPNDNIIDCDGKDCSINCSKIDVEKRKVGFSCGVATKVSCWGLVLLMSLTSFIFTPLDFALWEKLNMRPGLPPFDWWSEPPDEVTMTVYAFNVTNHERFISGEDDKLNFQEVGPVVYLEKLIHYDIKFNENSTLTYTAKRYPIFLPDRNRVDLNATIVVPNLAVLGLASYLHNSPFFVKAAFRLLVNSKKSDFFIRRTVYDYLWNYTDPVLDLSKTLAPGLVPVNNMGMLARIYSEFTDQMTVLMGPRWGHDRFFQIDRFQGQPQLPGFDPDTCPDRIFGSTEGVMYQQRLTERDVLLYWRKSVCKIMPLYFDTKLTLNSVPLYRYNLSENAFDRQENTTDCYDTVPPLEDGLSDGSKCYYDFPMVVSYPHFYTGRPAPDAYVTGMAPDRYKHNSYAVVEPLTGTPFHSVARMQSNLKTADLSGYGKNYDRFSNLVLPLFWAEYNQESLPDYIMNLVYFSVVLLPPLQAVLSTLGLIFSIYFLAKLTLPTDVTSQKLSTLLTKLKMKKVDALTKNKVFSFEQETFLKNKIN